jgi:Flp pilus assembly protein TadG
MRFVFPFRAARTGSPASSAIAQVAADESGTTAIEFAAVIGPFLFMLFGIISVGFYFFVVFSLEHAIETAARVIRTGQAQTQSPSAMTVAQFKSLVCAKLPPFMDCNGTNNKLRINVQSFSNYHGTAASCTDTSGALITTANQSYDAGGASSVVLATVCYEWDLSQAMSTVIYWISPHSARMTNGGTLIRASTTFTTEPYN